MNDSDDYGQTLWQIINIWLASRPTSDVFIEFHGLYQIKVVNYNISRVIADIHDDYIVIAIPPGYVLEASDPEFFQKFECVIKSAKERYATYRHY